MSPRLVKVPVTLRSTPPLWLMLPLFVMWLKLRLLLPALLSLLEVVAALLPPVCLRAAVLFCAPSVSLLSGALPPALLPTWP